MIQADHPLAVTRRCELLDVARSTVYYRPTGISAALSANLEEITLPVGGIPPAACHLIKPWRNLVATLPRLNGDCPVATARIVDAMFLRIGRSPRRHTC